MIASTATMLTSRFLTAVSAVKDLNILDVTVLNVIFDIIAGGEGETPTAAAAAADSIEGGNYSREGRGRLTHVFIYLD